MQVEPLQWSKWQGGGKEGEGLGRLLCGIVGRLDDALREQ